MFRAAVRENVYLELLEERHAAEVFSLVDRDREYLRQWLPWVDATKTADDTVSFIKSSLEQFASGHGFAAGIWSEHRVCGIIGTHKLDLLNRQGEIGYWLGQSFQGQGIVTAACRAMISHLFDNLDLHRIVLRCARDNEKSCAIAARLGFSEEGLAREALLLHGRFHDARLFALLRRDWKPQQVGL